MRLRSVITATILAALAGALLAIAIVVSVVLERAARRSLSDSLGRDQAALADMLRYRNSLHRAESRVLADEPRLKAVASTEDVTTATVLGVISDLRRALRCDLLVMMDAQGRLIADSAHPEEAGALLTEAPVVRAALATGESEGIWTDGEQVLQVHGRRLSYGTMTVGAVVVGYRMDDVLAESIGRRIGAGVVLARKNRILAASRFEGDIVPDRARLADLVGNGQAAGTPVEVQLAGVRYLMVRAPLLGPGAEQGLHYALFRSLDLALAPLRGLVRILLGITAAALVLATLAAVLVSRRLSRPIDDLVRFAQRIAAGDLAPAGIGGLREVRELGRAMDDMAREIATSRVQIAEKTRLAREMEIAERIQMSILPRDVAVNGLTLTAQMLPATEVGGDYYDVIPRPDGCWIGIGDVAGHGLPAGLVMLMVQSAFAALVRSLADATPRQIVILLNQVVFDNVRNRLCSDEHVTFSAARYYADGRLVFAGAHETLLLWRQRLQTLEEVPTPGTWLGVIPDITHATRDTVVQLEPGDLLVMYSDGVTEALNQKDEQFGIERLCEEIRKCADQTAAAVHAHILDVVRRWSAQATDDVTLLVLRHEGQDERGA